MKKLLATVAMTVGILFLAGCAQQTETQRNEAANLNMGLRLAQSMYVFHPHYLIEQDQEMQDIMADDLYRRMSLTNDQRQLTAFLRFENTPSEINLIHQEYGRVLFYFIHPNITRDRTFQLDFRMDYETGLVTHINESEVFFMLGSGRWYW